MKRRLRRRIFWTSVLSFVLSCALFAASIRWTAFFMAQFGDGVGIKAGGVFCLWTTQTARDEIAALHGMPLDLKWDWHSGPRLVPVAWWPIVDFGGTTTGTRRMISFQFWPIILTSAACAALTLPRRRFGPDRCPSCGHRLDGLPNGPCPECGSTASS